MNKVFVAFGHLGRDHRNWFLHSEKTENGKEQPEEEFVNPDAEGKSQIEGQLSRLDYIWMYSL